MYEFLTKGAEVVYANIHLSDVDDKITAVHLRQKRQLSRSRSGPALGANFTLFERPYEQDIACQEFRETSNTQALHSNVAKIVL